MPRIVVHCLLALLLCLNGFLAPFAMAGHAQMQADESALSIAPCHGGDSVAPDGAAGDAASENDSTSRPHDGAGCCKPGHCACAQGAAAAQAMPSCLPVIAASRIAAVVGKPRSDAPRAVGLRPPIA